MAPPRKRTAKASRTPAAEKAPYGWSVLGEDDRRIHDNLPFTAANEEKNRISSMTGEDLRVSPSALPTATGPFSDEPETEPAE